MVGQRLKLCCSGGKVLAGEPVGTGLVALARAREPLNPVPPAPLSGSHPAFLIRLVLVRF